MVRRRTRIGGLKVSLLIGGAAILAVDAARRAYRRSQLFCPTREPLISWNPGDYGLDREHVDEVWFEADDGAMLHGWYIRSDNPVASAVYCHGNTGNLTTPAPVMPHLRDSAINILLFDYRGFGRSDGIATLSGVIADTIAAARFHETIRPRHLPSILYGFSLGGAIAAQAVRRYPFDGLILQSTFTSLTDMARHAFPTLPIHWISGRVFDTIASMRTLAVPLLVIHGSEDETCPSWMASSVFESCAHERKQIHMVAGGLHKDLWQRAPNDLVWVINRFASAVTRRPRHVEEAPVCDRVVDSAFRFVRRYLRESPKPL